MKVVIFCGGLGVRMGEETQRIPKPMIRIGNRPILWHIMRYYASFGHTEFVLCLGYKGDVIKEYFLSHNEALFSDFVLEGYGADAEVEILNHDGGPWRITFADTGTRATIGERLKLVEPYLRDEEVFMATYGDGLTDVQLPALVRSFEMSGKMIMFALVRPHFHAHIVESDPDGTVRGVEPMNTSGVRINGGFFVMRRGIFDWIAPGDELVEETFAKLIPRGEVGTYTHDGFFGPMDTIKDRQWLEELLETGQAPWLRVGLDPAETPRRVMLTLGPRGEPVQRLLAIGAHSDDLEIGCGGTVLALGEGNRSLAVHWVVLAAPGARAEEARASAEALLESAGDCTIEIHAFRDGYLPHTAAEVKDTFEALKARFDPELVLTHARDDLHQDHRLACELTWNTFRNHLILEYEIPKWDGDVGRPNVYIPLTAEQAEAKLEILDRHFGSQRGKDWYDPDVFRGLMRIRGMECRAPSGLAEAFVGRKLTIDPTTSKEHR